MPALHVLIIMSGASIHFKFFFNGEFFFNGGGGGGVNSLICRFYAYVSLIYHTPITSTRPTPDRQETKPKITIH